MMRRGARSTRRRQPDGGHQLQRPCFPLLFLQLRGHLELTTANRRSVRRATSVHHTELTSSANLGATPGARPGKRLLACGSLLGDHFRGI